MKVLFFDTETTGLPKTREDAAKGAGNWPHLVSIAWIITENNEVYKQRYAVVKPEWEIPADSTAIHGITQEIATETGKSLSSVVDEFMEDVSACQLMVAHNMNFDYNVMMNAILWDLGRGHPSFPKKFCTMEAARIICKIPMGNGRNGYKSPKLSELYRFILEENPRTEKLHNSLYDAQMLVQIVTQSTALKSMMGLNNRIETKINANSKDANTLIL
jgi:DNA polymerase III epsilon subunit-like protein